MSLLYWSDFWGSLHTMEDCKNIAVKIFEYIIEKEKEAPTEIILDFDSSDIEIHGD